MRTGFVFWRSPAAFLIAAVLLAGFGRGLSGSDAPAAAESAPPEVSVAFPVARTIDRWEEFTGRFTALQQVDVRARVSGTLEQVNFVDGQMVKVGDLLLVIDPRPYQIAVESARAEVVKMKAQLDLAASDVARAEMLVSSRAITMRDIDQRKANLDVAKAQLLAAQSALRTAELNLEWTQVKAPIPGRVSDCRVDPGNIVQGGDAGSTVLTTIVTLDPINFVFDASEADYIRNSRLFTNSQGSSTRELKKQVMVRLADETEWKRAGVLNFVDNQMNARSGTIRARAIFDNKDLFLLPGTFGRLRLFAGGVSALLVPDAAVVSDQTSKVVYTVTPENKIAAKPVELGSINGGLRVVLAGLGPNDRVVVGGLANPAIRPGTLVQAIGDDTIATAEVR